MGSVGPQRHGQKGVFRMVRKRESVQSDSSHFCPASRSSCMNRSTTGSVRPKASHGVKKLSERLNPECSAESIVGNRRTPSRRSRSPWCESFPTIERVEWPLSSPTTGSSLSFQPWRIQFSLSCPSWEINSRTQTL